MFSDGIRAQRRVGAVSNRGIGAGEEEGRRRGSEGSPPRRRRQQGDDDSSDVDNQQIRVIEMENRLAPIPPIFGSQMIMHRSSGADIRH